MTATLEVLIATSFDGPPLGPLVAAAIPADPTVDGGVGARIASSPGIPMPDERSLVDAFARVAHARPYAIAIHSDHGALTYGELDHRSTLVASGLLEWGVKRGDRLGLCVERGSAVVVGMLGIMKAGAAYVPLDRGYPRDRLSFMCDDSAVRGVVCDGTDDLPPRISTIELDRLSGSGKGVQLRQAVKLDRTDIAYVIYTSGSTGRPKGVMVSHGNLLALLWSALPLFDIGPADRWSLLAPYSFDVSLWEMWMSLVTGASAVAVRGSAARSPDDLVALLSSQRVTVLNLVPSVFRRLVAAYRRAGAPTMALRYVMLGGEPIDRAAIRDFLDIKSNVSPAWVNFYGISEATINTTYKELAEGDLAAEGPTPIGRALPHGRALLLDDARRPVRRGEVGELWVAGQGVALGYISRPDLTNQRFLTIDVNGQPTRCYRSGDLARENAAGDLEYLGRTDNQVKLNGVRIELGEIEHALHEHPGIAHAAVVKTDGPVGPMLVAVVVPANQDDALSTQQVREFLGQRCPLHMLPNRVLSVTELPLGSSGKLERRSIEELAVASVCGRDAMLAEIQITPRHASSVKPSQG